MFQLCYTQNTMDSISMTWYYCRKQIYEVFEVSSVELSIQINSVHSILISNQLSNFSKMHLVRMQGLESSKIKYSSTNHAAIIIRDA